MNQDINQTPESKQSLSRVVFLLVLAYAAVVNTISYASSQLWVSPDASYYVELAGGLADHFDLRSQLFLIRPPGYPIFLAVIFKLFGSASPTAIMVAQHLMVIAIVLIVTLMAWRLSQRNWVALLSGLMAASSLQLITYANLVMTEVPFTLAFVWAVYSLVVFHQLRRCRDLALASLLTGVSYLFRPIGMALLPVCGAVAILRCTRAASPLDKGGLRRAFERLAWSVAPAAAVYLPCMLQNQLIHGGDLSTRCADLALYFRIVYMDKLDTNRSDALNDIRSAVAEAKEKKLIAADADYRLWGPVWQAYEKGRGVALADSSRIMGRAARDLIREHPIQVLDGTLRYSLWMILVPDGFYRFHPGGAPGICDASGECRREPDASILSATTYEPMMRPWTGPYQHYLPLRGDPTPLTPLWSRIARDFYERIEKGPSFLGVGDSPYEMFGWLCLLGGCACLFLPNRRAWLIVIAAVGLQVVVSAFLAGPTPRYAVPVRPLLLLFPPAPALLAIVLVRRYCGTAAASVGLNGGGIPQGASMATMSLTPSGLGSA